MQIWPAIFRLFSAISRALRFVFSIRARALAKATLPPLPMVAMPSSGSITSPLPDSKKVCFASATIGKSRDHLVLVQPPNLLGRALHHRRADRDLAVGSHHDRVVSPHADHRSRANTPALGKINRMSKSG